MAALGQMLKELVCGPIWLLSCCGSCGSNDGNLKVLLLTHSGIILLSHTAACSPIKRPFNPAAAIS